MSTTIYDGGNIVTVIHAAPPTSPTAPTITNMVANPNQLPVGGGPVTVNATVANATGLTWKLDGVDKGPAVLPMTVNLT